MPSRRAIFSTPAPRGFQRELAQQPELRSRLMATMGEAYQSLGLYAGSEALFRKSLDVRCNTAGVPPGALAESLNSLGYLLVVRGDFTGGEPLFLKPLRSASEPRSETR